MRRGARRVAVALCLTTLAVAAGCAGLAPGGGPGAEATPDGRAVEPPRDDAPYRSVTVDTVRSAHRAALATRTNGTVVVRSRVVGGPAGLYRHLGGLSGSMVTERRTAFSVATGEQRRRSYAADGSLVDDEFYRNRSRGYTRFTTDGRTYYDRATDYRNVSRLGVEDAVRLLRFDRAAPTVWRGRPAYRYHASGLDSVRDRYRENLTEERPEVTNVSATLYVRPDGLVVHARSLVETDTLRPDLLWNATYVDLNETDVTRPAWADDARRRLDRVSSVVTFERSDETLGVAATVTGEWSDLTDTSYDYVPANGSITDGPVVRFDRPGRVPDEGPVARHTVGAAAEVAVPSERRSATVTLSYDEGAVATDERFVAVASTRFDGVGLAVLAPNRTRVDARNDTVTAPVPPPDAFGGGVGADRAMYFAVDLRALVGGEEPVLVHVPGRRGDGAITIGAATDDR